MREADTGWLLLLRRSVVLSFWSMIASIAVVVVFAVLGAVFRQDDAPLPEGAPAWLSIPMGVGDCLAS